MWWGQGTGEVTGQREHDVGHDAVDAGHERRGLDHAEHELDGHRLLDDAELDGHGHERHGLRLDRLGLELDDGLRLDRLGFVDGFLGHAVVDEHLVDHDAGADHDEHRREEDAAEEEVIAI